MGRNGALSIEEWRPRWPPLWVHSTNLLNLIGNASDTWEYFDSQRHTQCCRTGHDPCIPRVAYVPVTGQLYDHLN
jgi:hypothetical protein